MKNKNIMALVIGLMALSLAAPTLATHTLASTIQLTRENNTNATGNSVIINITSTGTIINNATSFWSWTNETGLTTTFNLTAVQTGNQTTTPFYNFTWRNFSSLNDGYHVFNISISSNTTGAIENVTLRLNITIDNQAPSVVINQPTGTSSFSPTKTGNLSIDINTTKNDNVQGSGLDVCRVTIENTDTGTITVISNQTFTCSATSINLNPSANSGTFRVVLWENDTAGNFVSNVTGGWSYKIIGSGGSGGGGGGVIPTTNPSGIGTGNIAPTGGASSSSGSSSTNNIILLAVFGVAIWYFVIRKKKRR